MKRTSEHFDKKITTSGRTLDHAAKVYDLLSPIMTFFQEGRISRLAMELFNFIGNEKVLDVGCGTGTLTIKIAKKLAQTNEDFSVTGLDAAPKMVEIARRKSKGIKNIHFDVETAEQLPYADEVFDNVISTFFFHHINYELKKKALKEIRRVLKKEGKVIIVDVDVPTNFFGALCAWCGYFIFRQDEIKENIQGKLVQAIEESFFAEWRKVSRYQGYISIFELTK